MSKAMSSASTDETSSTCDASVDVRVSQDDTSSCDPLCSVDKDCIQNLEESSTAGQCYVHCGFVPIIYPIFETPSGRVYGSGYNGTGMQCADSYGRSRWLGALPVQPQWSSGSLPMHLQQPATSSRCFQDSRPRRGLGDDSVILTMSNLPKNLCNRKRFRAMLEAMKVRELVQVFEVLSEKSRVVLAVAGEPEAQYFMRCFNGAQVTLGGSPLAVRYSSAARSVLQRRSCHEQADELDGKQHQADSKHKRSPSTASTAPSTVLEDSQVTTPCSSASGRGRWADIEDGPELGAECLLPESAAGTNISTVSDADASGRCDGSILSMDKDGRSSHCSLDRNA